jgi:hypothetical protein
MSIGNSKANEAPNIADARPRPQIARRGTQSHPAAIGADEDVAQSKAYDEPVVLIGLSCSPAVSKTQGAEDTEGERVLSVHRPEAISIPRSRLRRRGGNHVRPPIPRGVIRQWLAQRAFQKLANVNNPQRRANLADALPGKAL